METKNLTVYVDNVPSFIAPLMKTSNVGDIKIYFSKLYPTHSIRLLLNKDTELGVFNTDQYDSMDISSVWDQIDNGIIYLTKIETEKERKSIAFLNMPIEEFAKTHYRANQPRNILGTLLFFMKNYQQDCFPQTKFVADIYKHGSDYYKIRWEGKIRQRGGDVLPYYKLNYPEGLFNEAKKCMADKSTHFVLFYLALSVEDPTLIKPVKELKKKTKEFYHSRRKLKKGESLADSQRMSFIMRLWAKKGYRFKQIYRMLKGKELDIPSIRLRIPKNAKMELFEDLINRRTKQPFKAGDELNGILTAANNGTFKLQYYPLDTTYDADNFLNKTEIINWYENYVEPLISRKGHANLLLLDTRTGEVERFEPHGGKSPDIYKPEELDNMLSKLFKKELGIKHYYEPHHICPAKGPQIIQEREMKKYKRELTDIIDLKSGTCVAWTMFYADLRLRNPDIPREQIIETGLQLIHDQPQPFTRYIVNFMSFLKDSWIKLDDEAWVEEMLKRFQ